jgi:hypothetical protein
MLLNVAARESSLWHQWRLEGAMAQWCALFVLAFLLMGCASPIALSDLKTVPVGEAIVFGHVKVSSDGKPLVWRETALGRELPSFGPETFTIFLMTDAASQETSYPLAGNGSFYWRLPPGEYTITGFQQGGRRGRIFALFSIAEGQSFVYIGTLSVEFNGSRYRMRIKDEHDQALQGFRTKFSEISGEPAKSLMQLEKPL